MNDEYASFVEEAFIKPIRSVLIVDDQYPTIDEIIDEATGGGLAKTAWKDGAAEVKKVLAEFRGSGRPYLLDIHDAYPHSGKATDDAKEVADEQEREVAEHLHQTDLLVLDYNLEPDKHEDGGLAISIIRKILRNAHFNLCVVHTAKKIDEVFPDVLFGTLTPIGNLYDSDEWKAAAERLEQNSEEDADPASDFGSELSSVATSSAYLTFYKSYLEEGGDLAAAFARFQENAEVWPRISNVLNKHRVQDEDKKVLVLEALAEFQESVKDQLSELDLGVAAWSVGGGQMPPWIRSKHGFITFTKKDDGPLFEKLRQALIAWGPRPSRLLATVVKSEIDERGIEVQDRSLGDQFAASSWYLELLEKSDAERDFLIDETVRYHSEQILGEILENVSEYMRRLIDGERKLLETKRVPVAVGSDELKPIKRGDRIRLVRERYGIDLSDKPQANKAKFAHNAFVCSKQVSGWHLQTGHILEIEKQLWCCLSPACDLVPGPERAKPEFPDYFEGLKRFIAVRLDKDTSSSVLNNATKGHHVYLDTQDGIFAYRVIKNSNDNPIWATFYAEDEGRIAWDLQGTKSPKTLSIRRLEGTAVDAEADPATLAFNLVKREAQLVAQLRYEYALNLLQTLGGSVTRIGLGFTK